MSQPTYRIPDTGVYLEADGTIAASPAQGATVKVATMSEAPALTAAYVGKGLQLMSDTSLGDYFLADLGASNSTREALKHVVEMTEFIVFVGDAIELGLKIAEWMGAFGSAETDPLMTILQRIDQQLRRIDDTVLQAWATTRDGMLAFLRSHSAASLRAAQDYLKLGRPRNDPFWANRMAIADRDSLIATETFIGSGIDGGFWRRPFSLKALGIDPATVHSTWLALYPDLAQIQQNPVWDYRFTLPATAYAIVVRLAVLKAISPDGLSMGGSGCREAKRYARFLRRVAERMQEGIWAIEDLDLSEAGQFQFLWSGRMPVAAANIYSGYSLFRILYAHELPRPWGSAPGLWPKGLFDPHMVGGSNASKINAGRENARLIGRHWWHLVWRGIGMVEMCQLISDVEGACTRSPVVHSIGQAQRLQLFAQASTHALKASSLATALAEFTSADDETPDPARTFHLYQGLVAGGNDAQQLITRLNEQLTQLEPRQTPARAGRKKDSHTQRPRGKAVKKKRT